MTFRQQVQALVCACDHAYRDHFAGGPCIAKHGKGSVCACLTWRVGDGTREPVQPAPTVTRLRAPKPAPQQPETSAPAAWHDVTLSCGGCNKTTYRPARSDAPCAWCGGALSATRELSLVAA